jgi:iron complex transport system ATP-binding protein
MKLEIQGIRFGYRSRPILHDVTLEVEKGEILALAGPNGSGKTTLLKCIQRILKPDRGAVLVNGNDLSHMKLKELACTLGYVPQSAPASFSLTVLETVMLGRKPHINWKLSERDKDLAFSVLKQVHLDHLALSLFSELSGGEKQKALIARAICQEPHVLILDEPTSNLDLKCQMEVLGLIHELVESRSLSAVMAIHDLNLAARFSTRMVMLKDGCIHAAGTPAEVLRKEIIEEVYEVGTEVIHHAGRVIVMPLMPARKTP